MKQLLFAVFLIQVAFLSPKYHIKKIWLFSKTQFAGATPKTPGGKPASGATTTLLCFLEASKDKPTPHWQTAYFNGKQYSVNALAITEDSVEVGTDKSTKIPIILKPDAGSKLIELELVAVENNTPRNADGFILEGRFNKKPAKLRSDGPVVELSPVFMP